MIFMHFMNVLNKPLLNDYSSREGTMCILVHWNKFGCSASAKKQDCYKYVKNLPSRSSICRWHKKFMKARSVLDAERSGRARTSAENSESVKQAFSRSPTTNWRKWWWICLILNPVPSLSLNVYPGSVLSRVPLLNLNIWFCFNEPGNTLCLLLKSNNLIRVYSTHSKTT